MNHPLEDVGKQRKYSFVQHHPLMQSSSGSSGHLGASSLSGSNTTVTATTSYSTRDPVSVFLRDKQFPVKKKLTMDKVPLNSAGILQLSENGCWREIRSLCERCLQLGFAPHENLLYRLGYILSQVRLHNYDNANKVLDSLGDLHNNGNYFYESYPQIYNEKNGYGDKTGNMVPWTMLLLKAIMPHFEPLKFGAQVGLPPVPTLSGNSGTTGTGGGVTSTGTPATPATPTTPTQAPPPAPATNANVNQLNSHSSANVSGTQMALDRLYRLLNLCRRPNLQRRFDAKATPEEWFIREQRVIMMIINCHICKKEYYLAQELLTQVMNRLEADSGNSSEALDTFVLFKSLQGCLYLQSGMIPHAEHIFAQLRQKVDVNQNVRHKLRCMLNDGYILFAKSRFNEASREFAKVLEEDPDNITAANNQAICLLHMCQLSKAIELLEEVIRRDPTKNLDEVLLYNLCTLYDLEADPSSSDKIAVIQTLVDRYASDDLWLTHTANS